MNKTFSEVFPSLSRKIGGIKTPMQKLSCFKKKRKESPGSIGKDLFASFLGVVPRAGIGARRWPGRWRWPEDSSLLSFLMLSKQFFFCCPADGRARQDYSQVKITAGFREPLEGRGGTGMKLLGVFLKQDTGVCVCVYLCECVCARI